MSRRRSTVDEACGDDCGAAALAAQENSGKITSMAVATRIGDLTEDSGTNTAAVSGNTIRAQTIVNDSSNTLEGKLSDDYASSTLGTSSLTFGTPFGLEPRHVTQGAILAETAQINIATGHKATVSEGIIGTQNTAKQEVAAGASLSLQENTIDASLAVNNAANRIAKEGDPTFQGSVLITNLQQNKEGSVDAETTESGILAQATEGDVANVMSILSGSLNVAENIVSSSATGNQTVGAAGAAGHQIVIGGQLSVDSNTTGNGSSTISHDGGSAFAETAADFVIANNQANIGTDAADHLTISSASIGVEGTPTIGAVVDAVEGGSVVLADNAVTSQAVGNNTSAAILRDDDSAVGFDATAALANHQINLFSDIAATTQNGSVVAIVGKARDSIFDEGTVDVSGNKISALAFGNSASQQLALDANNLTAGDSTGLLTGGPNDETTHDSGLRAKAGAMLTSLQANYSSDISANNAASVVGVYGDNKVGSDISGAKLTVENNTQQATAIGSDATNLLGQVHYEDGKADHVAGLGGNSVAGSAGIANVQVGDAGSSVIASLTDAVAGFPGISSRAPITLPFFNANVKQEESSFSVTDNVQSASASGTQSRNELVVESNSVTANIGTGAQEHPTSSNTGLDGAYVRDNEDSFHTIHQPMIMATYGLINDQSIGGRVNALGPVCIQGFPFVRNSDSRLLKENSREQTKPYR
ncbi:MULTISPECIES: beta strand repeat-containing protein [Brucella]|uniref:beta strand repeat-containing protein n=1 Tax=Brucella TaxID=234 RepID=UPI0018DD8DDF|nr:MULTISPECIES: hemagglutinin [unclassified Brucella]